jgi:hypothetical protein
VCRGKVRGREQGAAKEVAANKIEGQILRCDRLFLLFCIFPRVRIIPRQELKFYLNKIITVLVFPWEFFQGYLTRNYVANVFGFMFYFC